MALFLYSIRKNFRLRRGGFASLSSFISINQRAFSLFKDSKASITDSSSSLYTFQFFSGSNPNSIAIKATSRIHGVYSNISFRNNWQPMFRITLTAMPISLAIINITRNNLRFSDSYRVTASDASYLDQVWIQSWISSG